ncbi:MAG TPA: S41 family peptidase [Thermoanaerobaculia bacterium]|nr:S41 family peptidase [Thermoanaerobaculia bacterium]
MPRPWRLTAILVFVLVTLSGGLAGGRLLALGDDLRLRLRAYTDLIAAARTNAGTEVTHRDLVFASIQGMLRGLDPHSNFLTPTAYTTMRERQQGSFYGLGILVGVRNGQLTVISPMEGMPAARLGIRAGDVISAIEGEPTAPLSLDEAVQRLKGPKGSQVRITIVRRGLDEPLELTVTRAEIPQTTVRYAYLIAPGTGYLSIGDFTRSTAGEVARALAELRAAGMQRLLLDLRNNGGGLLDQAIEVADQFLPAGATIVETRGRVRDSEQTYTASRQATKLDLPLIVLVNGGTASAAEILAGAIQDHDLGLVLGTPTWGKGLVQTVYNLSYGSGLALTTAKYYTPSGRLIQRDYSSYWDYYTRAEDEEPGEAADPAAGETRPRREEGEAYATDLGRIVYGGGGITPDIEVELDELPEYVQFLFARNAFFNFALEILRRQPEGIAPDWRPAPELVDEFGRWLVEQEIDDAEDVGRGLEPAASRAVILRQVRSEVLTSRHGLQAAHAALAEGDAQIRAALGQFDQAAELLTRRAAAIAAAGERPAPSRRRP